MDAQAVHNLAVSGVLVVSMALLAWAGGIVVALLEGVCVVLWRCYRRGGVA